ncbi:hypothetical protein TWF106_004886 [Orbilia oligospora]|uniref:Uncharacterized protein n=1 Tax=Orbilia oligospora TaxID=2813651 RepID=A0A6G1MEE5_ORBOL|nr:hypothetical protein TWF788_005059 [Orbilia oligospora]KAF3200182.1 hypothetical protein TWF679_001048 [Orbilia oligospora]KAF3203033.1 hypothetical protein TWF191_002818 [Orbilia oligospora]KAF3223494.1 hypothetical protein TWF106_004886 [Orbilia oligospora]KAF3254555.1 hypothetical protein TWF192_003317 [Orbilia oligospora]
MTTAPGLAQKLPHSEINPTALNQPGYPHNSPSQMLERWLSESIQGESSNGLPGQELQPQRAERLQKVIQDVERAFSTSQVAAYEHGKDS